MCSNPLESLPLMRRRVLLTSSPSGKRSIPVVLMIWSKHKGYKKLSSIFTFKQEITINGQKAVFPSHISCKFNDFLVFFLSGYYHCSFFLVIILRMGWTTISVGVSARVFHPFGSVSWDCMTSAQPLWMRLVQLSMGI